MKNKKNIAKALIVATTMTNIPVNALANTIDEYKIENNSIENSIENNIKKIFARIFGPIDNQISNRKETIKVNRNIVKGKELALTLAEGQNIPTNLSGNPDGYETIKVITTGDKKLDSTDFANLKNSGIPKIDLSEAKADSIPSKAFYGAMHLIEFKFPIGVKTIGSFAFADCENLTGGLVIPDSVTTIGSNAFYFCESLTGNLVIPNSVTSIGNSAFFMCEGLTGDLDIPDGLTEIGDNVFKYCEGLTGDLIIPDGVTKIGDGAFYYCYGLTGNLVIPDSVTEIGESAFYNCYNLTGNLAIPDSITRIEAETFSGCRRLTGNLATVIPNSVTYIGQAAFEDCYGLTGNVVFPEGTTEIADSVFSGCEGLTGDLVIPDGVTTIGSNAFHGCSGLTGNLVIPDSVTSIGDSAFYRCDGLTGSIVIPESVTSIGSWTFYCCSGFTGNLVIPDSVTRIGTSAFEGCTELTGDLVLPKSLTIINSYAFMNCSKLTGNLVIPNTVTSIGRHAFYGCSGLTGNLVIPDSATVVEEDVFYGCTGLEKIIVKVDESNANTNYKESVISNLPTDKTYIEMPYSLDIIGTWLEASEYIKAQPTISTYSGAFVNNEGMGVSLEVVEASPIKTINILKDGVAYDVEKNENDKYVFNELGDYQVYVETDLGTVSNISFKNTSPIKEPSINYTDNVLEIIDNGTLKNTVKEDVNEEFDNPNDLKIDFSNSNWTIQNGILKSETIGHNGTTENEFTVNANAGDKMQIKVKTSSHSGDFGYIYLNGTEIYKDSDYGSNKGFNVLEFNLQEGENTIKFKYTKDYNWSYGEDAMSIEYIKVFKNEVITTDCDTLEYRIDGGEWQQYTDAFELNYPAGTKVLLEVRAKHDGFVSAIFSQEITTQENTKEIESAITIAEESNDPIALANARSLVNAMPESEKKNELQARLNAIAPIVTLTPGKASANIDVYIKSENMLSMSLNTNNITFEDFSGVEDLTMPNAVEITINSSLSYDLNAYMPTEITNASGDNKIGFDLFNIKESNETEYQQFESITDKIILKESCHSGNGIVHNIDLKLTGSDATKADTYKTTIKFEAQQK